ncbi:MAG: phenylalanine--tRNA ligase subunit beta, partial [Candidatus Dormibacteria bacterium]
MSLKISLAWLRDYIELPEAAAALAEALTLSGSNVEEVVEVGSGVDAIVVARILELTPVPGSSHLLVCQVEVGNEVVQVVTGAPNVAVGDLVPLARPGVTLPTGLLIKERKMLGVASQGMLCSPQELGLPAEVDGLLILGGSGPTGVPLSQLMPPDQVLLLEIEPNRPDELCHLGIARELSALLRRPLTLPDSSPLEALPGVEFDVDVEAPDLCPRYLARYLEGVTVGPSPAWIQNRLRAVGQRPINNVVDAANYVLLEVGQPLHTFDFDRLDNGAPLPGVVIRRARSAEMVECLDGRIRDVQEGALLIADHVQPQAIAGIIGGAASAVNQTTRRVLIESANFKGSSIRATSRQLRLRTEASSRFEKQLHPDLAAVGAARLARLLQEVAGAGPSSPAVDRYPEPYRNPKVTAMPSYVSAMLGADIGAEEIAGTLRRLQFEVSESHDPLTAVAPPFRLDIQQPADIVEEVGRMRGYNSVPGTIPGRRMPLGTPLPPPDIEWRARDIVLAGGFDEVIVQSFAGPGDPPMGVYPRTRLRLENPMSPDSDAMRTSLLPGLVRTVARNVSRGNVFLRLFELARVFWPVAEQELPDEARILGLALLASGARTEADIRAGLLELKGLLSDLSGDLAGMQVDEVQAPVEGLHPSRGLRLEYKGRAVGCIGQLHPDLARDHDLPGPLLLAEFDFEVLAGEVKVPAHQPLPRFPPVDRDLAVSVAMTSPVRDVINENRAAGGVIQRSG